MTTKNTNHTTRPRLPAWLKRPLPKGEKFQHVTQILEKLRLNTVCSSASCPNRGECYSQGTATFMIMGNVCTRDCRFCAISHGSTAPLESDEPRRLARAVRELNLKYVVITSVTRDDLPDGGAEHFAHTIRTVRELTPKVTIEVLTPDFQGDTNSLNIVYQAAPDVFNHNVETTQRLTPEIRSGADYERSLSVLNYMAGLENPPVIKSGLMLGLGETDDEISRTLQDLYQAGVKMLTIGQYLRPGKNNYEVKKYYPPDEFEQIKQQAEKIGFSHVAAGPFVRSSYHAETNLSDIEKSP